MSWDDEFFACPACGSTECVNPTGPENSPYLILGSYPGEDEIKGGLPFSGKSGRVMKAELRRAGLDFAAFRVTNLWKHLPNDKDKCLQDGMQSAALETRDKKLVLLVGAEAVKVFCGVSVEGYNGMLHRSSYFSAPAFICVQPTTVFHSGIGEFRLSMQKLAHQIEEMET